MSDSPLRLTRAQVREIDRRSIEQYHIPGIVLMENAARGAAEVACGLLGGEARRVMIVCGAGNNGGDGLAIARHLHNRGHQVLIAATIDPETIQGDARINFEIVRAMGLIRVLAPDAALTDPSVDLIVDAVLGTGLHGPPRSPSGEVIQAINRTAAPKLAIDIPSGLDCDTGEPLGACVRASRTVTFVAEKAGFANPASKAFTGEVIVADIGCPRELIEDVARSSG
jgi:NAD(P)H-hydrate epimerase